MHKLHNRVTRKPTLTMFASGAAIERYPEVSDLLAFDWYPIPWAPLATINRELRLARLAADGKPFYPTLQVFSWEAFPQLLRTETPLRPPTPDELRCMTYLSLLHGAHGILYYTYAANPWNLKDHPQLWTATTNLVADIHRDFPIFRHRVLWWPVEIDYEGGEEQMFNEIFEARVAAGMFELSQPTRHHQPGFYFVLINTSAEHSRFRFQFPFPVDFLVETADGEEVLFVDKGWLSAELKPFQVRIYGPLRPEPPPDWLTQ